MENLTPKELVLLGKIKVLLVEFQKSGLSSDEYDEMERLKYELKECSVFDLNI